MPVTKNVHINDNRLVRTWLAHFSAETTGRKEAIDLARLIYNHLFTEMIGREFPEEMLTVITRMKEKMTFHGVNAQVPVTIVDVIRAGMRPTLLLHEILLQSGVIDEHLVHEHHITAARKTDDQNRVIGVNVDYSKADEPVKPGSIVVFPDPMLATGTTLCAIISRYKEKFPDCVAKFVVVSMIGTQIGVGKIHSVHPEVAIYLGRMDRGLTDKHYIVPGAGGVGEIFTGTKK